MFHNGESLRAQTGAGFITMSAEIAALIAAGAIPEATWMRKPAPQETREWTAEDAAVAHFLGETTIRGIHDTSAPKTRAQAAMEPLIAEYEATPEAHRARAARQAEVTAAWIAMKEAGFEEQGSYYDRVYGADWSRNVAPHLAGHVEETRHEWAVPLPSEDEQEYAA